MRPTSSKYSHIERTAAEPRDPSLHTVVLNRVEEVNESIRLFRLGIFEGSSIKFLPGQWLDIFVPGVLNPGGFTITSPPSIAMLPSSAYLELAVQYSPSNPPAIWLWGNPVDGSDAVHSHNSENEPVQLRVRVGGSFVWPPQSIDLTTLRRVVFVAGGLGINPLMSILSHLAERGGSRYDVQFLYSTKTPAEGLEPGKILFLERLSATYGRKKVRGQLKLFLTHIQGTSGPSETVLLCNEVEVPFKRRRMTLEDIAEALGPEEEHKWAVVYVCGVPTMTDEFLGKITSPHGLGLGREQVLYEKWW
ncbi:NADH-cytochrome b-5 reductase [Colletotrichum graminicola M1.001]|uniref:NADH-cytochrome b-5 reductase n=1 Tax=Colletotrichum graminicola (strain M1.001 / M2 / FGSC 10212) TaxID=645133 RepID=E3Q4X3_COLGM|nr:NADH-cytochrome b-5 reductase [Colletotrichum graminicola M1.001]EFQ26138.1 NADH-cytochrome b-5 reductase [Colletotrichum graminicola M1.001]